MRDLLLQARVHKAQGTELGDQCLDMRRLLCLWLRLLRLLRLLVVLLLLLLLQNLLLVLPALAGTARQVMVVVVVLVVLVSSWLTICCGRPCGRGTCTRPHWLPCLGWRYHCSRATTPEPMGRGMKDDLQMWGR